MTDCLLLAADNPLNHVVQHAFRQVELPIVGRVTWLSNHIVMQLIAALLLVIVMPAAVRMRAGKDEIGRFVPRGFGRAIEELCAALRQHVVAPALGSYTDQFTPYVWSVFFFILFSNLLGLIPLADWTRPLGHDWHGLGGTSTGNVWVTGTLAACTLIMIVYHGLRLHGFAYVRHFFMGPFPISILIGVLEMIGLVAKTFALCMRLFANMVAGHVLLAVLLGFIGTAALKFGSGGAVLISIPVIAGSVAINFLELFVAFLQAFIFTFLTTMFIGQAVLIHHEHEEHDSHGEHAGEAAAPAHAG